MVKDERIELVIEGLAENDGKIRFNLFMSQLQNLASVLAKIDKETHDGKHVAFQVAALSFNSPYRIGLEMIPDKSNPAIASAIISRLQDVALALENETDLSAMDHDLLEDIHQLAKPIGKTIKQTTIYFNGTALELTPGIAAKVETALRVDEECQGTMEGMLEQINLHQGANTFHIYPEVGPKKVTCHFSQALYEEAILAVGRKVEVSGILKYRSGADFAHEITVTEIITIDNEQDLPDWDDIRGRAPDATGLLSSEDFVGEMRDAWE